MHDCLPFTIHDYRLTIIDYQRLQGTGQESCARSLRKAHSRL